MKLSKYKERLMKEAEKEIFKSCPGDWNLGNKFDSEKPRWDLLPFEAVEEIVQVLTYGAKKYNDNNWQLVKDARKRYFAALMRHLNAWWLGETTDRESGLSHLAHAGCCVLFLIWFSRERSVNNESV